MKDEQQAGLNYLGFLSTPPTSCRTQPNSSSCGGFTTRRSLPKSPKSTFNGIYEGDFTMFDDNIKGIAFKSSRSDYHQPIMVDQLLGDSLDLGLEQHDEHLDDDVDEIVDEEIRGKTIELEQVSKTKVENLWEQYKGYLFNTEQCEKIECIIGKVQEHVVYRKLSFAVKCVTVITIWILRLLLCSVIMRAFDASHAALRSRNILRSGTRRILWFMTLAKCGDVQLYGLIMLLSPVLFLVSFLGFIFASYVAIKNGIYALIGHVRYRLDVEPPKFD